MWAIGARANLWLISTLICSIPLQQGRPIVEVHSKTTTGAVSCIDKPAQIVRSATIVSSQGGEAAYVETRNQRLEHANPDESCRTTWVLYTAIGDSPFSEHIVDERTDVDQNENQFEIIGWSADGSKLLAATIVAAGDSDETAAVIYTVKDNSTTLVRLAPAFRHLTKKNCGLYFGLSGFSKNGEVVLRASALEEPYLAEGAKPCFAASTWLLDYHLKRVRRAPPDTAFEAQGTLRPAAAP